MSNGFFADCSTFYGNQRQCEKITPESVELAVANAARYMDQTYPGWEHKIDLSILDIHEIDMCVFGQIAGSYSTGMNRLVIDFDMEYNSGHFDNEAYELYCETIEQAFYAGEATPFWIIEVKNRREHFDRELDLKRAFADALVTV